MKRKDAQTTGSNKWHCVMIDKANVDPVWNWCLHYPSAGCFDYALDQSLLFSDWDWYFEYEGDALIVALTWGV